MKYFFIVTASLMLIAGCGKSQQELEKEKIQKDAQELKHKLDSMGSYIDKEKKSLDSNIKSIDSLGKQIDKLQRKVESKKLDQNSIQRSDELIPSEKPKK